jgi:alkylation response protein AidB-like acyl-CoA dehydrogenase
VDFRLNEEQEALKKTVRAFCEARVPFQRLAELEKKRALDRDLWSMLGELGVFGLRAAGLGAAEGVLVFTELGRRVVPGPLVYTHLAAGLLDGAGDGRVVVGGLDERAATRAPILIEHLESLDELLVLGENEVRRVDAKALSARPIETPLDPLTPISEISALPAGERIGGADEAARFRRLGTALVAAQMLGIAEASLELAVAHAKTREQFGRPIGSFQAIKHMCADMFVSKELARAAVYAAGATLDQLDAASADRAVACAKIVAERAADKNARACLQIHGGMGYTWEIPVHYLLKRAWILRVAFGSADEHAERLAPRPS